MQVSIPTIKVLGHYIHDLENPQLNYQHLCKSDKPELPKSQYKQETLGRICERWVSLGAKHAAKEIRVIGLNKVIQSRAAQIARS